MLAAEKVSATAKTVPATTGTDYLQCRAYSRLFGSAKTAFAAARARFAAAKTIFAAAVRRKGGGAPRNVGLKIVRSSDIGSSRLDLACIQSSGSVY